MVRFTADVRARDGHLGREGWKALCNCRNIGRDLRDMVREGVSKAMSYHCMCRGGGGSRNFGRTQEVLKAVALST